jgi:hypothetical protein
VVMTTVLFGVGVKDLEGLGSEPLGATLITRHAIRHSEDSAKVFNPSTLTWCY